ncbi:hypothetical protein GUJ93_ZPchr0010g9581 [Zizania palustris]|uniref:Glutathione S-transferase n=1 Tax=Zizania palustris TaxID=103762 RepID=A0A8J5RR51_ZIZPA|nr:hypothetical protein GUJ93_ZPchr0003g16774 [Zizania palustris]KAG8088488.1 hypothetical protein GUJ93_ZPchr0010g9581 [Zizania palustris]
MEGEKQQPGVVLLNCSASPFNNRVGNALTRKGVAYEKKLENLPAISPLLFSSNPILAQILVWRSLAGATGLAAMEGSKGLVAVLRTLEAELGGRRYIDGESLGYVDMALVPLMMLWFLTYERFGGFCVAEECPTLAVWRERDDSRGGRKR